MIMNRFERRQQKRLARKAADRKAGPSFEQLEGTRPAGTNTAAVERAFLYKEPTLKSMDADYKMRQLQPRISIREGWRFVY